VPDKALGDLSNRSKVALVETLNSELPKLAAKPKQDSCHLTWPLLKAIAMSKLWELSWTTSKERLNLRVDHQT